MLEVVHHCCVHDDECCSSVIDLSTPHTLQRDFNNWLNGIDDDHVKLSVSSGDSSSSSSSSSTSSSSSWTSSSVSSIVSSSTDGRKNRKKGTNLYGRPYCPGRPLSMTERTRIIELHNSGMKVNAISKSLCISHGCVSKIISRFRTTGVLLPACSPEQRKSRKRKADGTTPNTYLSHYIHDANGNEYLNDFSPMHHYQLPLPIDPPPPPPPQPSPSSQRSFNEYSSIIL